MLKQGLPSSSSSSRSIESATALRRFFAWLESRYGGLPIDTGSQSDVIVCDRMDSLPLQRLMSHDATAILVKGFYPTSSASRLGEQLAKEVKKGKGRNWKVSTSRGLESSDVFTLGAHAPYNVALSNGMTDEYFDGVRTEFEQRRLEVHYSRDGLVQQQDEESAIPLWPLDKFRLELDEAWPEGAGLARHPQTKQPFGGGLPRVMLGPTRWKKGFIHVDEMAPLSPTRGLFSANVYLKLPGNNDDKIRANSESNGSLASSGQDVLEIWPVGIRSRWDWYRNATLLSALSSQDPELQLRLRRVLGKPLTVSVESGDMVLICAQRPHAAIGFSQSATTAGEEGIRVSLQCFVQHDGPNKRLLIDS